MSKKTVFQSQQVLKAVKYITMAATLVLITAPESQACHGNPPCHQTSAGCCTDGNGQQDLSRAISSQHLFKHLKGTLSSQDLSGFKLNVLRKPDDLPMNIDMNDLKSKDVTLLNAQKTGDGRYNLTYMVRGVRQKAVIKLTKPKS